MSHRILNLLRKTLLDTDNVTDRVEDRIYAQHLSAINIEEIERDSGVAFPCLTLYIDDTDSIGGKIKEGSRIDVLMQAWSKSSYVEANRIFNEASARGVLDNKHLSDDNYNLVTFDIPIPRNYPNNVKNPTIYIASQRFQVYCQQK